MRLPLIFILILAACGPQKSDTGDESSDTGTGSDTGTPTGSDTGTPTGTRGPRRPRPRRSRRTPGRVPVRAGASRSGGGGVMPGGYAA